MNEGKRGFFDFLEINKNDDPYHITTDFERRSKNVVKVTFFTFVGILLIFIFNFFHIGFDINLPVDTEKFDHFGSIIGGLIGSLLSFTSILFILDSINRQEKIWQKDKIDGRFFELIRLHKENVNNLKLNDEIQGVKVLDKLEQMYFIIYSNLLEALKSCLHIQDTKINQDDEIYKKIREELIFEYTSTILFYGCNENGGNNIDRLKKEHSKGFSSEIMTSLKPFFTVLRQLSVGEKIILQIQEECFKMEKKFIFQSYFPLLFQIILFINRVNRNILSYEEKKDYIKLLKAMLYYNEQVLILLHSLASYGKKWEKENYYNSDIMKLENDLVNKCLITKFDLIRNVPIEYLITHKLDPREVYIYPYVSYSEGKSKDKGELYNKFN